MKKIYVLMIIICLAGFVIEQYWQCQNPFLQGDRLNYLNFIDQYTALDGSYGDINLQNIAIAIPTSKLHYRCNNI